MMKRKKLLILICVLWFGQMAPAVYTPHIGGSAGATIYVKGPYSGGPDNSPLHESWNLTDETIDGDDNPNYLGLYYRFIFYDGTLHIDPTGKVGFTEKIFASGNNSTGYPQPQHGTVNVEGILFGPEIRPWKNGCDMTINVWGDHAKLQCSDILRIGVSDGGVNNGVLNLMGGTVQVADLDIYGSASFIDITGGELLIRSSSWSSADVTAAISTGDIVNSSGHGLYVTTRNVDSVLYTSVVPAQPPNGNTAVRLHCAGRQLADANDNPVQLRGIYSRAAWLLEGGGELDVINLRNWGCNFMRITVPFDPDYWDTVNGGVFDINKRGIMREQDLQGMDQIASWCENNGMYFMLCQQPTYQGFDFDLLARAPTDPDLYAQQMADVATLLAQRYGHYNYLLGYEPFGEPHGINTSSERNAYRQICTAYVDAIRVADPGRIVSIAACDGYAHPGYFHPDTRIDRDNILYTFSYYPCRPFISYQSWYGDIRYPDDVPDFYRDKVIWLDADWLWSYGMTDAVNYSSTWNVPVYCHEFGAWGYGQWDASSPDDSSVRYMQDMVHLFENNQIPWIIWRWQTHATAVPQWWPQLWAGQSNNRVVIEPHGGQFVGSETVTIQTFVEGADIYYTTDGTEPDETSTLYSGALTIYGDTTVKARAVKAGLHNPPVDTAIFTEGGQPQSSLNNPVQGLRYWYYEGDWGAVPDFDLLQSDATGNCSNFHPYLGSLADGKALFWKGHIDVPQGAVYYFNSRVDAAGAMQMFIDDQQVLINGMNTATGTTYSVGQVALEAGTHTITLGYTRPTGAGSLFDIEIQRPTDSQFVNIPASMLYRDHSPPDAPSDPAPSNSAINVPINLDLRWKSDVDTVSHDFYFGSTNPPPFLGNQSGAAYDPGLLEPDTTYYWRVIAKNTNGTASSDLWTFTTGSLQYLIGWWKFDEAFGSMASDSSGSNNHGQLMNFAGSAWVPGRNGNALSFDGYDDYVWIPYDPTLDLGTGDFSMSLWVRKDAAPAINRYLYNQRKDGLNWFYLQWKSYDVIQAVLKSSGTERLRIESATSLSSDTWYHIVLVVDRDSATGTKMYLNGVDDTAATPIVSTEDYSLGAGARIGRWSGGGEENFVGTMDDFRFFGWALNPQEVRDLYDFGFLSGDIDKNDRVDFVDVAALAARWQDLCSTPDWCEGADVNKNGTVDANDLVITADNWLEVLD